MRTGPLGRTAASGDGWTSEGNAVHEQEALPMSTPEPESLAEAAALISNEIAAIHRESYGESLESIETHILDDLVVCVLDIRLLPHERTLLEHDRGDDSIRRVRKEFQESIAPTFSATVEHTTGRRVIAFLSETHLDPSFSVEIFKLAPAH
jgi:uncharacterized protein YbcI